MSDPNATIDLWVAALDRFHTPKITAPIARTMAEQAAQTALGQELAKMTDAGLALQSVDISELTGSQALMLAVVLQSTIDLLSVRSRQVQALFRH